MNTDLQVDFLLRRLIIQWNTAERRIKAAEQANGMEVVSSAIFELRYAGRKLIDVLDLMLNSETQSYEEKREIILRFLGDAIEDCVKAKHDAVDAMIAYVTVWFNEKEKIIGLDHLIKYFPEYVAITGQIFDVQMRIAKSREDRRGLRDHIYDEIEENGDFSRILSLFHKMSLSEDRVRAQVEAEKKRREKLEALSQGSFFWTKTNAIWAAVAVVIAVIALFK